MLATTVQQYYDPYSTQSAELTPAFWVLMAVFFAVWLFYLAAMWKIFTKAGEPGWHAIVPILNTYTLCRIAGRPGWWWLLMAFPCTAPFVTIIVWLDIAKVFGKGTGFGLGLIFLSPIFVPILAFGSSTYGSGYSGGYSGYGGYSGGGSGMGPAGFGGNPYGQGAGYGQGGFGSPAQGGFGGSGQTGLGGGQQSPGSPSLPSVGSTQGQGWTTPGSGTPAQPTTPQTAGPAEGWYPDPSGGAGLRWWDGNTWTEHTSG